MSSRRWLVFGLVAVVALGAWLRLHRLSAEGLWLDEAASIAIAQQPLPELIAETAADVHPPLYYLLLHAWMAVTGSSELAVRLFSVLCGLAGILAVYFAAARLFDRGSGVIAAALVATSPFHVYYSQEARMYALLALLATVSMHAFVALLQRRPSRLVVAVYVATNAAMLYTHMYGVFIVAAQYGYVAAVWISSRLEARPLLRRWIVAQAALAAIFTPWAIVLIEQLARVEQGFWISRWPLSLLPYTLVEQAGSWWRAAVILPLAIVPVVMAWRSVFREGSDGAPLRMSRDQWRTIFLFLWLGCPILLPFLISQVSSPIFLPKYTIVSAVALTILAGRGIVLLRKPRLQMVAVPLLAYVTATALVTQYSQVRNDRWREAVRQFEALAAPRDLVLFGQPWGQVPFDYYRRRIDVIERQLPPILAGSPPADMATSIEHAVAGHDRVWFVISQAARLVPLVEQAMSDRFELVTERRERGVQMFLFEKRGSTAPFKLRTSN